MALGPVAAPAEEHADGRPHVRVQPETAASFRLEVEDTGPGIRAEDMGRLFVEFQQLDAGLTKKHAGTGLGLSLTKRIVAGALRRAGYTVELATTGSEGLTKFRSAVFDAVTLNLLLPDMSGLDVIYEMRQHPVGGEVPVVIVTAVTGESELIGLTVRDVLRKPIDAVSVLSSLVRAGVVSKRPGDVLIVVDDDERTLKLLEVTLTGLGYTVHPKLDGVSALRAAATVSGERGHPRSPHAGHERLRVPRVLSTTGAEPRRARHRLDRKGSHGRGARASARTRRRGP
ncbi:MAG: response regulator [Polyangiaceae bacterium]